MHNTASVLENYTHELLWDFDIQTDDLILARRLGMIILKKKIARLSTLLFKTETMWKEG